MNETQKIELTELLATLLDAGDKIEKFRRECRKKAKQNLELDERWMYEDFERMAEVAGEGISSAKTQISAILEY